MDNLVNSTSELLVSGECPPGQKTKIPNGNYQLWQPIERRGRRDKKLTSAQNGGLSKVRTCYNYTYAPLAPFGSYVHVQPNEPEGHQLLCPSPSLRKCRIAIAQVCTSHFRRHSRPATERPLCPVLVCVCVCESLCVVPSVCVSKLVIKVQFWSALRRERITIKYLPVLSQPL